MYKQSQIVLFYQTPSPLSEIAERVVTALTLAWHSRPQRRQGIQVQGCLGGVHLTFKQSRAEEGREARSAALREEWPLPYKAKKHPIFMAAVRFLPALGTALICLFTTYLPAFSRNSRTAGPIS